MHIDDYVVQRLVDAELDAVAARTVREHVAVCEACRNRIERARHEDSALLGLLESIDHPVPSLNAAQAIAASRTAGPTAWRRAAMIPLLVLGAAGAAYALPGSPVRVWVDGLFGGDTPADPVTAPVDASSPEPESTGGLAVDPGRSLVIRIENPPDGGIIEATLYDGALVEVTTRGGTASFASDADGRIAIRGGDPATRFVVRVPRNAAHVEIRIDDRTVFVKTGPTVVAAGEAGADGVWMIRVDSPSIDPSR